MSELILLPGDLGLTHSDAFLGKAIRFFTRSWGESRTQVNHYFDVVTKGTIQEVEIIEALTTVKRHKLWTQYGSSGDKVAIFRRKGLTEDQLKAKLEAVQSYVGRDYGYLKLVAHFLDWCIMGAYVFRRLALSDNYPICTWSGGFSWAKAGVYFGKPPAALSPDDIWDYVVAHPEEWECVHQLNRLS